MSRERGYLTSLKQKLTSNHQPIAQLMQLQVVVVDAKSQIALRITVNASSVESRAHLAVHVVQIARTTKSPHLWT